MDGAAAWVIATGLAVLLVLAAGGGWRAYGLLSRRASGGGEGAGAGALVGASLGLLSLLIGFTLALSLDRYEARRDLVVREAAAISTTWQRDQLLDQPFRGRLDGLLRDYVRERRALASVGTAPAALDAADRRAGALHQSIWLQTAAALKAPDAGPFATTVLQATGEMFDLAAARRAELDAQVPPALLWTLALVAVITAAITGYGLAAGGRAHWTASTAFFVVVVLALALIFELDEPRSGFIRVSQAPMERVASAMLAAPPPAP